MLFFNLSVGLMLFLPKNKNKLLAPDKDNKRHFKDVLSFLSYCFKRKKILIITEKKTLSLSISSYFQIIFVILFSSSLVLFSYGLSRYLALEEIVSEKERKVWIASVANKNLRFQISNMRNSFAYLYEYIANSDLLLDNKPENKNEPKVEGKNIYPDNDKDNIYFALNEEESDSNAEKKLLDETDDYSVGKILFSIRDKVSKRIKGLERFISFTGLNVNQIADANLGFKYAMRVRDVHYKRLEKSLANEGGPFIPLSKKSKAFYLDKEQFDVDIKYLLELENLIQKLPLTAPLASDYYISSYFGARVDPMRKVAARHEGVDLVGKYKGEILATADGIVSFAGRGAAYGNMIDIRHTSSITTRYGHLNTLLVKQGDRVKKGQVIGLQGNTGRSTGSHLHYEISFRGEPINPYKFLQAGQYLK